MNYTKVKLPTVEKVKSFTQEMIDKLPRYDDIENLKAGDFARYGWMRAPNSLVYILHVDPFTVYYQWANAFNGYVDPKEGYAASIRKSDTGNFYYSSGANLQDNSFLIEN